LSAVLPTLGRWPPNPENRDHTALTAPAREDYAYLMANVGKKKLPRAAMMLGVGLDHDGHKRVTRGDNFLLAGGSKETHEVMTEKVVKINEKLTAAGKRLEDVSAEQFDDIAHSVGLHRGPPPPKKD
jgi:hypothetical protein